MSRTLFDQARAPQTRNCARSGTVLCSVLFHALFLGALVALQLGGALDTAAINRPVVFAMSIGKPPLPPEIVTRPDPRPGAVLNRQAAPTRAPEGPPADPPLPAGDLPGQAMRGDFHTGGDPGSGPLGPAISPAAFSQPLPPSPIEPVHVGGQIKAPERLSYTRPAYPAIAQTARVDGTVILETTIDETGAVTNVRVLRSIALLDQAAIDAVARWRYTPTRLNGVAVPVIMTVTVTFTLR